MQPNRKAACFCSAGLLLFSLLPLCEAGEYSHPVITGYGGIAESGSSAQQPRSGSKVLFDITGDTDAKSPVKGLDRVALFVNLSHSAGIQASRLKLAAVLHGSATRAALRNEAYRKVTGRANPNIALLHTLRKMGVELYVCNQALAHRNIAPGDVTESVKIAASALTVLANKQMQGYAYAPFH